MNDDDDDGAAWGRCDTMPDVERYADAARAQALREFARVVVEGLLAEGLPPDRVRELAVPAVVRAMDLMDGLQRAQLASLERTLTGAKNH